MIVKTYFSKNNTLIKNSNYNTGLSPICELFYGGLSNLYSRFIFKFDETNIKNLYTGGTFTDLNKLKHTLKLTNTGLFDKDLLNTSVAGKARTSSFDLIVFKIEQEWDNGVGYDYENTSTNPSFSVMPSNWVTPKLGQLWSGGTGVYSGSPSSITIATQHFDKGNENLEVDITNYVNGLLTGDTNNGLGIAFDYGFEQLTTSVPQYVGFFTNNTQTFYEPFLETKYENHIKDDRNNFYLDKNNKLYLYVNINGNPANLDTKPTVKIYDQSETLFSSYTQSDVNHITKGVYSIDVKVPTTLNNQCTMYNDVWSGITINGINRPDISMNFVLKDSNEYYNIGDSDSLPKKISVNISGIQNNESIKRGDIRKVVVSTRIPFTTNQSVSVDDLKYRLYVKEGNAEYTVIDFTQIEMTNTNNYFLLDTNSLLPNTYYLDVLATSNLEVTTIIEPLKFIIINDANVKTK